MVVLHVSSAGVGVNQTLELPPPLMFRLLTQNGDVIAEQPVTPGQVKTGAVYFANMPNLVTVAGFDIVAGSVSVHAQQLTPFITMGPADTLNLTCQLDITAGLVGVKYRVILPTPDPPMNVRIAVGVTLPEKKRPWWARLWGSR